MIYSTEEIIRHLLDESKSKSKRYIENEQFLISLLEMKWYIRIFQSKKLIKRHIKSMIIKYNF
jgi:hypothetical protein